MVGQESKLQTVTKDEFNQNLNSRQLLLEFWLENEKRLCDDWLEKQFQSASSTVRIGSLFSGIGGIEHAFQRLGLKSEILFAGDIDKFAKISYLENHSVEKGGWHDDVNDFCAKKYNGVVDLLVGGSPCQAFSMVGKRQGMKDPRGKLFYEYVRILNECKPKVFIFENVKGLVSHNDGETWHGMKSIFEDSGYNIHWSVLNSKNYGIPQHRERVFVVGFKEQNNDFRFPAGFPLEHSMQDFLEDFVESNYYLREKGIKFVTSTKNRIKKYTQINGEIALCQKANQQFNWHGDFVFEPSDNLDFDEFVFDVKEVEEKYYLSDKLKSYVLSPGTKNFRTRTDTDLKVARPLLQTMHKMHRAGVDNYVTHDKGRIRKLTPRECVRLMGFRDDFKIAVSDTQMYRQAGNSIVVDVLIALLKQMDITKFAA